VAKVPKNNNNRATLSGRAQFFSFSCYSLFEVRMCFLFMPFTDLDPFWSEFSDCENNAGFGHDDFLFLFFDFQRLEMKDCVTTTHILKPWM
jgi:hypothetical protein